MRLFFAIYPDSATRKAIHRLTSALPASHGRRTRQDNLHLTLAFLGSVDETVTNCVMAGADKVTGQAFDITLDTVGFWPRPKVAWMGCSVVPAALAELAGALQAVIKQCGLEPDSRPFRPHVTMLRKASQPPELSTDRGVSWSASAFVLMESVADPDAGVIYRAHRSWSLGR